MSAPKEGDQKQLDVPPGVRDESRRTISNPLVKDVVTFVKYGYETNGEYTELHLKMSPGGELAPHYHTTYTETFTALKGLLGVFTAPTGKLTLKPEESRKVPLREVHYLFNDSDADCECKIVVRPSHEGFEKSLYVLYGLARDGECRDKGIPKSFAHGCLALTMADLRPAGLLFNVLSPIVYLTAAVARWRGVEEQLFDRYWR